jgi:outer membrane PBP1 activator LpoA protein
MRINLIRSFYLLVTILLLSSCGDQTIRPDRTQYVGLSQAQNYYQQKNYHNAAVAYEELFNNYHNKRFAILAADSWLEQKNFIRAQQLLAQIGFNDDPLYALIQAQLSQHNNDYANAKYHIDQIADDITGDLRPRYLLQKAQIEYHQQNYLESALLWIELAAMETGLELDTDIMNSLLMTPEQQLTQALFNANGSDDLQQGWLEAAYAALSPELDASKQWKTRWPDHPGILFFSQENPYSKIAVLLPLTGKYKNISSSIQQGMLAALYQNGVSEQTLDFFDTGSNGESFSFAWYGAIESGAEFIIGPLEKNSIKQLTQLNSSTVPVLLLNKLEDEDNPFGFYQFPLSQEDEVYSVASRLIAENKKRVLLLAPESSNGRKLAIAFEKELLYLGGQVVNYKFYPEATHDYSTEIKHLLGLNDSQQRASRLQTILSTKLTNTPQVRPDIDAIFIIAKPQQARLIKPQLKFFQAENVPVFATSQLLASNSDPALDKDLNGIKFCQSAFVIDPLSLQDQLNFDVSQINSNRKFFAFGFDAISMYSKLEWMQRMQSPSVEGMSGLLRVDGHGILHRELSWAQFHRGQAVLIPPIKPEPEGIDTVPEDETAQL